MKSTCAGKPVPIPLANWAEPDFSSEAPLRATLSQYIGEFYNYSRLHSA